MTVKAKVILAIIVVIVAAGGVGAFFYLSADEKEGLIPNIVEETTYTFPYTGLKTSNEDATKMRPLCVKIPNDIKARPQTNINEADVVYETMVEGGETRMNAIFQSKIPEEVGPVRSARLSDIWIVPQYNGMLFFSGANDQVRAEISSHDVTDMRWSYAESIYFRADNGRGNLHNLHIKLNEAYDAAEKRGYETEGDLKPLHYEGVKYDSGNSSSDDSDGKSDENKDIGTDADSKLDSISESSSSGAAVAVKIAHNSNIEFKWDEDQERYLKWMNGSEHMDAVDDKQINVVNVVVLWADYTQQAKKDAAGSPTYDTTLGGKGKAAIFKDGNRYDCEWKANENTPPRFFDSNGEEVLLKPGNTWIVIPPTGTKITSE